MENHNPEVIVIDEIGRELEALAARTIAERGVQLIGTAHGNTLDNLLQNPTLSDLVGGIEAVTLSDEEARRRGTQKTVLERRAPAHLRRADRDPDPRPLRRPHGHLEAVDTFLRGYPLPAEIRTRDEDGSIRVEKTPRRLRNPAGAGTNTPPRTDVPCSPLPEEPMPNRTVLRGSNPSAARYSPVKIYPYGVARNRLMQAAKRLGVPAVVVREPSEADALMTLRAYYRNRQQAIVEAESAACPSTSCAPTRSARWSSS